MKNLTVILSAILLSASLLTGCGDSNKESGTEKKDTPKEELIIPDMSVTYHQAYLETVNELNSRYEDVEWTYGLIDVDGDQTPELVASYPATISLYTYADGNVYTIMDETSYGFAGNNGYYYLPGKNVIFNSDYDMAGTIVYETYCKIGEKHELENYHNKPLYTTVWKDANGNGTPDDNEIGDTTYYYYGNNELSETAYNELRFGDSSAFEPLYGEMTYDEAVAELGNK